MGEFLEDDNAIWAISDEFIQGVLAGKDMTMQPINSYMAKIVRENSQQVLLESGNIGKITYKNPKVGDIIDGNLLWGEDIIRCKIFSDAGISRDAFIVQTPSGGMGVMLEQSIISIVERDGVKWEL